MMYHSLTSKLLICIHALLCAECSWLNLCCLVQNVRSWRPAMRRKIDRYTGGVAREFKSNDNEMKSETHVYIISIDWKNSWLQNWGYKKGTLVLRDEVIFSTSSQILSTRHLKASLIQKKEKLENSCLPYFRFVTALNGTILDSP